MQIFKIGVNRQKTADYGAISEITMGFLPDFRHMDWFADKIGDRSMKRSIVLYSGTDTLSFGKNRLAVPLAALYS